MKNRQKVKSTYKEYLSKSDGNTNIVFRGKFLAFFGNGNAAFSLTTQIRHPNIWPDYKQK